MTNEEKRDAALSLLAKSIDEARERGWTSLDFAEFLAADAMGLSVTEEPELVATCAKSLQEAMDKDA